MTPLCPGPGCDAEVDFSQLMCPGHWRQVPKAIRRAVWICWNRGNGQGALPHAAAIRAAIAAVNRDGVPASSLSPRPAASLSTDPLRAGLVSPARTRRP